jgi:hypothetical protein
MAVCAARDLTKGETLTSITRNDSCRFKIDDLVGPPSDKIVIKDRNRMSAQHPEVNDAKLPENALI